MTESVSSTWDHISKLLQHGKRHDANYRNAWDELRQHKRDLLSL